VTTTEDLTYNAMDLYNEAHILSRLNHPNIIHLHGVTKHNLADSYQSSDGFFVLLDIMQDTLFEKLDTWRNFPKPDKKVACSKSGIVQRLRHIALPVVEAMEYLHDHQIVLRDLKPENIGFDTTGQVKLFDFGLARVLSLVEERDVAGSICYMAPEIMLEQGTFLVSDVYSFAIVCWELCTLQIPLARFTNIQQVRQQVSQGNWRPPLSGIPSKTLRQLIQKSWARNPVERPDFGQIIKVLNEVCSKEKYCDNDMIKRTSMRCQSMSMDPRIGKQKPRILRASFSEGNLALAR
jgi:serine/threonine protein kinase